MGEVIQLAVKSFEKLGLTPLTILILIVMILLFIWLFKQVTFRQEKLLEEEKLEMLSTLNQYCNLYKTLVMYKEEMETRETLLNEFANSIPFLKKETYEKLECLLFNDQHIEEGINDIKEKINKLRKALDELNPRFDRGTTSGRIGFTIRIVELILQPIFITMVVFVSFLYFMFVGLQSIISPNIIFINNLTIVLNLFLLLSFFASIVDKKIKCLAKNICFILAYFLIITVLLVINNIFASVAALILFFVFTTVYNPRK